MTQDIKEKATNPENDTNYLMKMTKTENILPKPRLLFFSFDFRLNQKEVNNVSQCFNILVKLITDPLSVTKFCFFH